MIRKMLVIAAAVAMPAAALAGVTAVGSSAIASAKTPVASIECPLTGTVTFAKPGLSKGGAITNKTVEDSSTTVTPSGSCGTKSIKEKIATATTECAFPTTTPTVCTGVTALSKDKYYYDTDSSFTSAGVSSIVASLSTKGIKAVDNGNTVTLKVGDTGGQTASSVLPGGVCGSDAGFQLTGGTSNASLTYVLNVCLTTDTGTGTTGSFLADIASSTGTIATAAIGGSATLDFTLAA